MISKAFNAHLHRHDHPGIRREHGEQQVPVTVVLRSVPRPPTGDITLGEPLERFTPRPPLDDVQAPTVLETRKRDGRL